MDSKNNRYLIIGIFTIAIVLFSGTLAYWQWESSDSQQTEITFTIENNFKCSVDGGGDITSSDVMLAPASCTNSKYAIKREITTDVEITGSNMSVLMDLWLDVNSIDSELKNSSNFKYAITTNSNSCTDGYINGGTFSGNEVILLNDKIYSGSKEEKYYLYVWLDSAEENSNTQGKSFSLSLNGNCTSSPVTEYREVILNGADPVLESGMIPVTIADNGDVTTADLTQEWYSYSDKQWANAVLVNSDNRMNYFNTDGTIKGNQLVTESDILAYFVWIPRYRYAFPKADGNPETISIIFENSETTKSKGSATGTSYYTHPAFTFGNDELNGIWVGKFETTGTGASPTILPNIEALRGENTEIGDEMSFEEFDELSLIPNKLVNGSDNLNLKVDSSITTLRNLFEVSLKFAGGTLSESEVIFTGNNIYGLTQNTDSHMMKNSEWGAVAYLSHSIYGINKEIRLNNNSRYITGCGALSENGSSTSSCQIEYGMVSEYLQSTTGNISGIFDMSGGTLEYVMGNFNNTMYSITGFDTVNLESKYYDVYLKTIFTGSMSINVNFCKIDTCGGNALHETNGWYNDVNWFVDDSSVWFERGHSYFNGENAGVFAYTSSDGKATSGDGFRTVITKGI